MYFNSAEFLFVFLPAVLIGFVAVRRMGAAYGLMVLLLASLLFYAAHNPAHLLLLLASILCNYGIARLMVHLPKRANLLLGFGVVLNLLVLAAFKYGPALLLEGGLESGDPALDALSVLPLAISFFTFQQIAFLVDVQRRELEPGGLLPYAGFVAFFPQLIAGPIVRFRELAHQLQNTPSRLRANDLAIGLTLLGVGLFKKIMIADPISDFSDPVFDLAARGGTVSLVLAWQAVAAFSLQIYFDFSAYSEMAMGLARLFGIVLPCNFLSPYQAASFREFWRRWHITLSRFLRDYLYLPLGGSRNGRGHEYFALLVTMGLGGLWHGSTLMFGLWGLLHGCFLVAERLLSGTVGRYMLPARRRSIGRVLTPLLVCLAWVPFRAESWDVVVAILGGLVGFGGVALPAGYAELLGPMANLLMSAGINMAHSIPEYAGVGGVSAILLVWVWTLIGPNTMDVIGKARAMANDDPALAFPNRSVLPIRWNPTVPWACVISMLWVLSLLHMYRVQAFIYFVF